MEFLAYMPNMAGGSMHSEVGKRVQHQDCLWCRYAGFIFAPDQHEIAMQRQATKRTLGKFVDMHGGEEPTEEVWP